MIDRCYKHITIVNDDRKWRHNLDHHPSGIIHDHNIFIRFVRYDNNMFKLQATVAMIVNHNRNPFTIQTTGENP